MLNNNVINALQALNGITNSAILRYPTTVLNNSAGDMLVKLDFSSLDTESFDELGIFNLSEFISTFKLFNDYKCSVQNNVINITSGNSSIQYLTTNTAVLENFNKKESVFEGTEKVPSVCDIVLTQDDIKAVKSASAVFKDLEDIIFIAKDGDLEIKLGTSNSFNASSNSFSIRKPNSGCTKDFTVKIPAENFNSVPLSDYNFSVKYNEERDAYRVLLKSTEVDVSILLAVKV